MGPAWCGTIYTCCWAPGSSFHHCLPFWEILLPCFFDGFLFPIFFILSLWNSCHLDVGTQKALISLSSSPNFISLCFALCSSRFPQLFLSTVPLRFLVLLPYFNFQEPPFIILLRFIILVASFPFKVSSPCAVSVSSFFMSVCFSSIGTW